MGLRRLSRNDSIRLGLGEHLFVRDIRAIEILDVTKQQTLNRSIRRHDYIRADPQVKIRFGTKVYLRTAVLVGSPGQLEEFSESRYIYRLDPRENE